jgi:hypothetical protein
MRHVLAVVALLVLSGCPHWFGPADGIFYAVGTTPSSIPCRLSVAPVGSNGNAVERPVSGDFRESIIVNPSHSGHRAMLICDSTVVAERAFKYGHDVRIGGELLVTGSAP